MQKYLLAGFGLKFLKKANEVCKAEILDNPRNGENYDIVAINELKRLPRVSFFAKYLLCPEIMNSFPGLLEAEKIITCGMSESCDLTLSSVGIGDEKKAALSISRPIILPNGSTAIAQEIPMELQKGFTLYENIVLAGLKVLCGNWDVIMA